MRSWLLHARESFWFLPTIFGICAIVFAVALVELDRYLVDAGVGDIPLIADLSATGGRAILAAIGGTMLGVAATSFSITISVLATTSAAYGPRLVRNFMADRGNQFVLAVLTSTFLYALIVLRSVHTEADSSYAFVPVLAVSFSVVLAVGDVAVLVYFIHHIATSVQVTTLQKQVLTELESVINLLYPIEPGDRSAEHNSAATPTFPMPVTGIVSRETGYVGQIQVDGLVASARRYDCVYRMRAYPGDYVLVGDVIVEAAGAESHAEDLADSVVASFTMGPARTPHQDARFAVQQVTEIGVRGLASGTNDPYTAVSAIDALGGALATLCTRPVPSPHCRDDEGTIRVLCQWPSAESLIADTYLAIRTYAMDHPLAVRAAMRLSQRLETVATGDTRLALRQEVAAFHAAFSGSGQPAIDAEPLAADFIALDKGLAMAQSRV
jgi:uncharacterized membrane protein